MEKIIRLIAASNADELTCADGEVAGNDSLFETPQFPVGWPGGGPPSPSAVLYAEAAAIPPYSAVDGMLPSLTVQAPTGSDSERTVLDWLAGTANAVSAATRSAVVDAVRSALKTFLKALADAGLYFSPVRAAVSRLLVDGRRYGLSEPVVLYPPVSPGSLSLSITASACRDGLLYMTLSVSRSPFRVEVSGLEPLPAEWKDFFSGYEILVSSNLSDINADAVSAPVWVDSQRRGFTVGTLPVDESAFAPFPDVLMPPSGEGSDDEGFRSVTTRPLKLGDPFAVKRVTELRALWPDGSLRPVSLYGAMQLGKWHFLGLARQGAMRLRGSGWRFFRVATFAAPGNLPLIRLSFQ